MKKRILSLLLAVCLCVGLLPTVALAADPYGLSVCGKDTTETINSLSGVHSTKENDTLTLKLTDAMLDSSDFMGDSMIRVDGTYGDPLIIDLVGENTVTVPANGSIGIFSPYNIRITSSSGDGSLTIKFADGTRTSSVGIYATKRPQQATADAFASLTIDSGVTVTVNGGNVSSSSSDATSYGVMVSGDLTVNGTLNATGGDASASASSARSYGVSASNSTVNGTLTATSGKATSSGQDFGTQSAACSAGDLTVYGKLTAFAGPSNQRRGGVFCSKTLTVHGETAELTATYQDLQDPSNVNSLFSVGIQANRFNISGGATVTAEAAPAYSKYSDQAASSAGLSLGSVCIEGARTTVRATGNTVGGVEGAILHSTGMSLDTNKSAEILGGTVELSGKTCGLRGYKVQIGSATESVNFTAEVTADETDGIDKKFLKSAVCLTNNIQAGTLTLTNAQIVEPVNGKMGFSQEYFGINLKKEEVYLPTAVVVDEADEPAMQVRICSTAKDDDDTLPGWLVPILCAPKTVPFDDVTERDWFYDDVSYVNELGLMTGTADRVFSPNAPVTRGMVMTILARYEGVRTDRQSPWYAAGVEWAVENGISDGTNPEAPITREQLAAMLYRYAVYAGYASTADADGNLLDFQDAQSISGYALDGMRWAVAAGLVNGAAGLDAVKLLPQATATRAQLAAMLHRFFG